MNSRINTSSSTSSTKWWVIGGIVLTLWLCVGIYAWLHLQQVEQANDWYTKGRDYYKHNHLASALELVNKALDVEETVPYLSLKYDILNHQGKEYETKEVLKTLIEKEPNNDVWYMELGGVERYGNYTEQAIELYKKAIELNPNNVDNKYALATAYYENRQYEKTIEIYTSFIQANPTWFQPVEQYVALLNNTEQYDKALAVLADAKPYHDQSYMYYFKLAGTYDHKNDNDLAVKHYRKSLELHPMKNSIAARRIFEITGKHVPPELENMSSKRIPYTKTRNLMIVEGRFNDTPGKFLVDTGASLAVVFKDKAKDFNIKPLSATSRISTANGLATAQLCTTNIGLGPYTIVNTPCAILPRPPQSKFDGIIGNDTFQAFRMEVDSNHQQIILSR